MRIERELPIHIACLNRLNALLPPDATRAWHTPNENMHKPQFRAKLRDMGLRAGVGDLSFVWRGRYFEIEIKAPGGRQSPEQKRRQAELWQAGAKYALVSDPAHIEEILRAWGIPVREPIPVSSG